jgi:LmbE family N-acetylglucosaminyl deacetylase
MNDFESILVLAPHADDAEFGCGGTIARFLEEGRDVYYAVFSKAVRSLEENLPEDTLIQELTAARQALGFTAIDTERVHVFDFEVRTFPVYRQEILEILIEMRDQIQPDLVLLPSLHDIHQDHATVAQEGIRAFKRTTILGYELPWNNLSFSHQVYVSLRRRHIEAKARALSCYESQKHRNYANVEYIWSLAKTRSIDVDVEYAEVFEAYRWIL